MEKNFDWMEEKIKSVPQKNGLYTFMKIFLFKWKGLSYKEMYLILRNLYSTDKPDEESKEKAFIEITNIYYFNNKHYPKIEENERKQP